MVWERGGREEGSARRVGIDQEEKEVILYKELERKKRRH